MAESEHSFFDRGSEDGQTQISQTDENELAEIRVRTMYNLVEEIKLEAGSVDSVARVLYITNMQAQMFSVETVPKMMQAFEVKKPSLVINLLFAMGAGYWNEEDLPADMTAEQRIELTRNQIHNTGGTRPPFLSNQEKTHQQMRLTMFFKDVLLPLAAETNAILLVDANGDCSMSKTLAETLPLFVARYGGEMPFTLFAIGAAPNFSQRVMSDPNSNAAEIAHRSKNWRKGFAKLEALENKKAQKMRGDLQPNMTNYLIVESISGRVPERWRDDRAPMAAFQNTLLQALSSQLPTVCIRTGGSTTSNPLSMTVEIAGRKIPTLMLDCQDRSDFGAANASGSLDRGTLINKAIEFDKARHDALWEKGTVDCMDQHRLAFFYDVLNGDGDQDTVVNVLKTTESNTTTAGQGAVVTLAQSIEMAEERTRTGAGKAFTPQQLTQVIEHIMNTLAESRFRVLPIAEQEKLKEDEEFSPRAYLDDWLRPIWSMCYDILSSPNVYGANLKNLDAVANLINQIVKRDRLPQSNSLQSMQMLRRAWNIVDICAYNAKQFKIISKVTYLLNLLLGLCIIALTVFRTDIATLAESDHAPKLAVFIVAALLSFLTGLTTFYNPTQRWRELRDIAEAMHSEILRFRTRTGAYEVSISDARQSEACFMSKIEGSISTATQSAALSTSSFQRSYPRRVYTHGQNPEGGDLFAFDHSKLDSERPINTKAHVIDDHHSPMKPTQYITARLVPMLHYYQSRVPAKYKERKIMTTLLLASTIAISMIAFADALSGERISAEKEARKQCLYDAAQQTSMFEDSVLQACDELTQRNMGLYTSLVAGVASCLTAWQEFKVSIPRIHASGDLIWCSGARCSKLCVYTVRARTAS
jgi:hypothetical protein